MLGWERPPFERTWHYYVESSSPDRYLRLTFGPDGRLTRWQKVLK